MAKPDLSRALLLSSLLAVCLAVRPGFAAGERRPFAPPDEPRHDMPERGYDLRHLRLDLSFDMARGEVSGTATNTLAPLRPGLDRLIFHAAELAVRRVRLAGHEGDLPFSLDPVARTLTVDLGRAYGPDDVLEVAIDYAARPRTGLFFVGPDAADPQKPRQVWSQGEADINRHWFPSWDYPNDRATSELLATVERPLQVIGNGRLVEVLERPDGRRTWHWSMERPHPTYLISVVVGEFSRVAAAGPGAVPVESWVPPGREEEARATFGRTPEMMAFFAELTGTPYPFPRYSQVAVHDFPWGGMENISATTESERLLHTAAEDADFPTDDVVAHELAHQWFGDLVGFRSWDHFWLSEGFAEYLAALWAGHAEGRDAFDYFLDVEREAYLAEDRAVYRRPIVTLRYPDPVSLLDAHSYQKGALVLHMIRSLLGEDAWRRGLREYLRRYADQSVTTADLETTLEQVSGVPLGPLFDQYVYGAGHPELAVRWDWQPETRQVHLEVEQRQRVTGETGFFSFPVEIALVGAAGTEVRRVPLAARRLQDLYLPTGERPRTVVFDPHGDLLKTLDFAKPLAEWIVQLETAGGEGGVPARLEALRALGDLGGGMSRGAAEAAAGRALRGDPFYGVRAAAVQALGALATDAALAELRAGLADRDSRVRGAAFRTLASFPEHRELIPPLREALAGDASPVVRASAATALGAFTSARAEVAPLLLKALAQKSHGDVVARSALRSLAKLGAPQTFDQAVRLARLGPTPRFRAQAAAALALYASGQPDAAVKEKARRLLEGLLADPGYAFRASLYPAFAELGDPAAIPALESAARNEVDVEQRLHVEEALRALKEPKQAGGPGEAAELAGRVEQLEREAEVLRARLEELEKEKAGAADTPQPP
jgi:aminopeptidase N